VSRRTARKMANICWGEIGNTFIVCGNGYLCYASLWFFKYCAWPAHPQSISSSFGNLFKPWNYRLQHVTFPHGKSPKPKIMKNQKMRTTQNMNLDPVPTSPSHAACHLMTSSSNLNSKLHSNSNYARGRQFGFRCEF
jgi:hypothetical protein